MPAMRSAALLAALLAPLAAALDIAHHKITSSMVAVYTPMTSDGLALNLTIIPAYAARLKALQLVNVLPAGSNGESLSLSVPERKALAEAWAAAGKAHGLRIYNHVGSESLVEAIDLAKHSAALDGIAGVLAMTPVYFKPTIDTLHDFLAAVAGSVPDTPFWFYHFPDDTAVLPGQAHVLLQMIHDRAQIPNFMGIKYTDYNLMDFEMCTQVGGGKYNMLYGRDEQLLAALVLGADAGVSSTIQYAPSLRQVAARYAAGDEAGAKAAQETNARLCSMFGIYESAAKNVQKSLMRMTGIDCGPSRLPKRDLDSAEYAELEARLRAQGLMDTPEEFSELGEAHHSGLEEYLIRYMREAVPELYA